MIGPRGRQRVLPDLFTAFFRLSLVLAFSAGMAAEAADGPAVARHITSLLRVDRLVFVGTWGDGVSVSGDSGRTWEPRIQGLRNPFVYSLAYANGSLLAATGGGGVFQSEDLGLSWTPRNDGLIDNHVFSVASIGDVLVAGTWRRGVFRSADMGARWRPAGMPMRYQVVYAFVRHNDTLWAGTANNGVFWSADSGATWTSGGLAGSSVLSLAFWGDWALAGTWSGGLYRRGAGDDTIWRRVSEATDPVVALTAAANNAYALQHAKGVLRASLGDSLFTPFVRPPCDGTALVCLDELFFAGTWGCGLQTFVPRTGAWVQNRVTPAPAVSSDHGLEIDIVHSTSVRPVPSMLGGADSAARRMEDKPRLPTSVSCEVAAGDSVRLGYSVSRPARLRLCVYNVHGRRLLGAPVDRLVNPGEYRLVVTRSRFEPGAYFVQMCLSGIGSNTRLAIATHWHP